MNGHSECVDTVRSAYDRLGVEVTVSTVRPLVVGPYPPAGWTCPHKVTFWCEPTGEQIAQWVKDGEP